ncbi:carboxymuconolactone decarboxylase family protein [Desulfitobacterium sp. PCE1]|uniref:carboxymuconolactone decarboxylase family protein n=1 Tax=Desulfitobacterium sp. PCE1 TaxID=146907 RepID=UPI00036C4FE5|nr:carboxymuconolactone decarboxylase family protein [Desulfitobacterium sp. PCE1]
MNNKVETPICNRLQENGYWNNDWNGLYNLDPVWTEKYLDMAMQAMSGIVDPKTAELIAIAVDASCTHMYAPGVRRHIQKALELGVTQREIMAVLESTTLLSIHSCAMGVPILMEEVEKVESAKTK